VSRKKEEPIYVISQKQIKQLTGLMEKIDMTFGKLWTFNMITLILFCLTIVLLLGLMLIR